MRLFALIFNAKSPVAYSAYSFSKRVFSNKEIIEIIEIYKIYKSYNQT